MIVDFAARHKNAFFFSVKQIVSSATLHFLVCAVTPDGFWLSIRTVKAFTLKEVFVAVTREGGKQTTRCH
jgi:hypothetical protein